MYADPTELELDPRPSPRPNPLDEDDDGGDVSSVGISSRGERGIGVEVDMASLRQARLVESSLSSCDGVTSTATLCLTGQRRRRDLEW